MECTSFSAIINPCNRLITSTPRNSSNMTLDYFFPISFLYITILYQHDVKDKDCANNSGMFNVFVGVIDQPTVEAAAEAKPKASSSSFSEATDDVDDDQI